MLRLALAAWILWARADNVEIVEVNFYGRRLSGTSHDASLPEELTLGFKANGTDFKLQLWRNRVLLPLDARHIVQFRDGSTMEGPMPDPCFYIGTVSGDAGGSTGFSACGGRLDGMVLGHGRVVLLKHVGDRYEATLMDEHELNHMLGDVSEFVHTQDPKDTSNTRRLTGAATKHVEALVVNDYSRTTAFGGRSGLPDLATHSAAVMNLVTAIYRKAPTAGTMPYGIQVVLTGMHSIIDADPWEDTVTKIDSETDCSSLLTLFNDWGVNAQSSDLLPAHDNRVLLSGRNFDGNTVGLAGVSGMCNPTRSGNVNMCGQSSSHASCAGVVAHEMGHNFGMHHDSSGNACPQSGLIMEAVGDQNPSDTFSGCSVTYITTFFNDVYPGRQCLENMPTKVFGDPVCRNGLVEEGEDCDCGQTDCTGIDACCNGNTCKFAQTSYQCSNQGITPCCESCMFVTQSAAKTCRAATNVCDMAETCPGGTATCPRDDFYFPGKSCTDGAFQGICSKGNCESLFNTCKVDITRDFDGSYDLTERCAAYDDSCGALVCHDASASDDYVCAQRFSTHGKQMLVPDGSPCWFMGSPVGSRNGMCYLGKCSLPFALAGVPLCGNGGIDVGEQCDCGGAGGDSCCECSTCKLKAGKQCSQLEPCCDSSTCMYKAQATTCRAATGTCDDAEVCSGSSGVCPTDSGKQWGTDCTATDGTSSTCYGKVCLQSLNQQCSAKTSGTTIHPDYSNSDCKGLMCCAGNSCSASSSSSTFTIEGSNGQSTSSTIWIGGALDGTLLADKTKMCMSSILWTPQTSGSCTTMQYYDASVGRCLNCAADCMSDCTGPTNLECSSCQVGAKDSRGACGVWSRATTAGGTTTTTTGTTTTGTTTTSTTTTGTTTTRNISTTSTTAGSGTTLTTTTTALPAKYQGSYTLQALGVNKSTMETVAQKALATHFGLTVADVAATVTESRRLNAGFRRLEGGTFLISFELVVPPAKAAAVAAAVQTAQSAPQTFKAEFATVVKDHLLAAGVEQSVVDNVLVTVSLTATPVYSMGTTTGTAIGTATTGTATTGTATTGNGTRGGSSTGTPRVGTASAQSTRHLHLAVQALLLSMALRMYL